MNRLRIVLALSGWLLAGAALAQEASEAEHATARQLLAAYGANSSFARPRACRIHDRVTITINEAIDAKHEATTDLKRDSTNKWEVNKWFNLSTDKSGGLIAKARNGTNKPEIDLTSSREHSGDGQTERKQTFKAEISGEVLDVMPNGQLVIEARSQVKVNEEDQVLILTGRVEPRDLDATNTVEAKYLIDKRIKFDGQGDLSIMQKRGWGSKILDKVNPF